jgi:hypothetical protein
MLRERERERKREREREANYTVERYCELTSSSLFLCEIFAECSYDIWEGEEKERERKRVCQLPKHVLLLNLV